MSVRPTPTSGIPTRDLSSPETEARRRRKVSRDNGVDVAGDLLANQQMSRRGEYLQQKNAKPREELVVDDGVVAEDDVVA